MESEIRTHTQIDRAKRKDKKDKRIQEMQEVYHNAMDQSILKEENNDLTQMLYKEIRKFKTILVLRDAEIAKLKNGDNKQMQLIGFSSEDTNMVASKILLTTEIQTE